MSQSVATLLMWVWIRSRHRSRSHFRRKSKNNSHTICENCGIKSEVWEGKKHFYVFMTLKNNKTFKEVIINFFIKLQSTLNEHLFRWTNQLNNHRTAKDKWEWTRSWKLTSGKLLAFERTADHQQQHRGVAVRLPTLSRSLKIFQIILFVRFLCIATVGICGDVGIASQLTKTPGFDSQRRLMLYKFQSSYRFSITVLMTVTLDCFGSWLFFSFYLYLFLSSLLLLDIICLCSYLNLLRPSY